MANTTGVRQSKLKRLVFAPQTTIGTAETLDASTLAIPVIGTPEMSPSRGTKRISRADVLDAYAGEAIGVIGSVGWTASWSTEIHDTSGPTYYPYWAQILMCAGHEGDYDAGTSTVTFKPTTKELVNWAAPTTADSDPACATIALLHNHNDSGNDAYSVMYDSVGSVGFNFTTGERATMDCSFSGRVEAGGLYNTGSIDIASTGSFGQIQGAPFVCKAMNVTLTDNTSSQVVTTVAINNVVISSNIEMSDVNDMTDAHGFALSPSFQNSGASVAFEVADGGGATGTERYLMQNLLAGNQMAMTLGITGSAGRSVEFNAGKIQFDDVGFGETNGYSTFTVNGTCVRTAGTNDDPYTFVWTFA